VAGGDLRVAPQRGLPLGLTIPADELDERFSRSSGPGGQGVNTTDSRVELSWSVAESGALTDEQRATLLTRFATRLVDGAVTIAASERRSQLQNRLAARERLATMVGDALTPTAPRRPTRPSRAAKQRRLDAKHQRGELKATRARVDRD
jgi:ribosome-associated protein